MSLRNAFANLVTESVTGAIEAVLTRIAEANDESASRWSRREIMEAPRSLQYAKTTTDAMRVNVENWGAQVLVYKANTSDTTVNRSPYQDNNAVFMVDERWQQFEQSMQTFNAVRTKRWTF